jgi:hypothetical protein
MIKKKIKKNNNERERLLPAPSSKWRHDRRKATSAGSLSETFRSVRILHYILPEFLLKIIKKNIDLLILQDIFPTRNFMIFPRINTNRTVSSRRWKCIPPPTISPPSRISRDKKKNVHEYVRIHAHKLSTQIFLCNSCTSVD